MPRQSKKSQYKQEKRQVIFLLRSPKTKEFFVGHCSPNSLIPIFRQHWAGNRNHTNECFTALKKEGIHPCLTVLEECVATDVKAYAHVVAWTKVFVEAGYTPLNQGNVLDYINDMLDDSAAVYEKIKTENLDKICDCSNCEVANYGRERCPFYGGREDYVSSIWTQKEAKSTQLNLRLTETELEQIQENAKYCDRTVSAYAREVLLNMCFVSANYADIKEHSMKIQVLQMSVMQLIFTILKRREYVPKDVEYILDSLRKLEKMEAEISENHSKFVEIGRKEVRKEVRRIVNKRAEIAGD